MKIQKIRTDFDTFFINTWSVYSQARICETIERRESRERRRFACSSKNNLVRPRNLSSYEFSCTRVTSICYARPQLRHPSLSRKCSRTLRVGPSQVQIRRAYINAHSSISYFHMVAAVRENREMSEEKKLVRETGKCQEKKNWSRNFELVREK